jgi:hypothetical protein
LGGRWAALASRESAARSHLPPRLALLLQSFVPGAPPTHDPSRHSPGLKMATRPPAALAVGK